MGKTLLLTGVPGIGKTTIIRKVLTQIGSQAGGFYTEEIAGAGGRKGFKLLTLDGKEAVLAHKDLRDPQAPRIGRYGVDVKTLERVGIPALQRAMREKKLVVIDEIGMMELTSAVFCETVMAAIMGPTAVLGTIMSRSHPESDAFKMLAQVTLWEVNRTTRDDLPDKVLAWINKNITQ